LKEKRTLPSRIQQMLARFYGLGGDPDVDAFVVPVDDGTREVLAVRDDGVELAIELCLPRDAIEPSGPIGLDQLCQVVEGVSHFVYLAERARRELPATHLELELQAEVDKYVTLVLAAGPRAFVPERAAAMRERLFARVGFVDPPGTERGERYRLANDVAARFACTLETRFARRGRFTELAAFLRRFYASGQREKLELARAA
jgi:hypothetical protein